MNKTKNQTKDVKNDGQKQTPVSQNNTQTSGGQTKKAEVIPTPPPMALPSSFTKPSNCPPGLEYLSFVDQLIVKQRIELLQVMTGFETKNRYEVHNTLGQNVFYAKEETDFVKRHWFGSNRGFDIVIWDNMQQEVIHLSRPLRCQMCCCFCCLQFLRVESPPGNLIGHIIQNWSPLRIWYTIENSLGQTLFKIRGPILAFHLWFEDIKFDVLLKDKKTRVGKITKQWSGIVREFYTNADVYGVHFPMEMNVRSKALILSAAFLIDFMYFENTSPQQRTGHHNPHHI